MSYPNTLIKTTSVLTLAFTAVGCQPPTSFKGEAQFPGGPSGCFQRCKESDMEMATFVYVGDYSSACACKLRTKVSASSNAEESLPSDESATVAAAAGVELQRRRLAEQQQQQQMQMQQQYR